MLNKKNLREGQRLIIQVTGDIGNHEAIVVGHDSRLGEAIVEVTDESMYKGSRLKREDYIAIELIGTGSCTRCGADEIPSMLQMISLNPDVAEGIGLPANPGTKVTITVETPDQAGLCSDCWMLVVEKAIEKVR